MDWLIAAVPAAARPGVRADRAAKYQREEE